ncbi:hypothetical protein RTZ71_29010 [Rhodococcus qingshengii]|uniref:hypothetical protein n=1 Tax=Rhodococcus qingshengii TaxID=334542 RepID=UPI0028F1E488|nr:hypothetical protein [Rhodococcus qingshengii]MDT9664760.1 hypothetical protein [Rhodococcus qingshengii]
MLIIIAGTVALLIYLVRKGSRDMYRPSIPDRWPHLPPTPPLDRSHVGDTQLPTAPPSHEARTTPVPVPDFVAARIREGSFERIRCPNCNQRDLTVEWIPFDEPLSTADGDISYELWCSACKWIALVQGPAFPSAPQAEEMPLQNRNSEDSSTGTGGTPSGKTSLSLGSGAFQVYDESISDRLSDLLSHHFDHPRMYCFAQDWRGIQFFILDKLTQNKPETMVYIYDPARGIAEELLPYGLLLLRIADGTILNGCALDQFAFWLQRAGLSSLDVGQCITPRVFVFLGGNEEDYDTDPRSALPYVHSSLKMKKKLRDSGLKDGDILTEDSSTVPTDLDEPALDEDMCRHFTC